MMKNTSKKIPTFDQLMNPLIKALQELGGSGTIEEINQKVFELAKIPDEVLEIPHGEDGSNSEVEYRLAWSRTYLKKFRLLENSARGVWSLLPAGKSIKEVNPQEVVKKVREETVGTGRKRKSEEKEAEGIDEIEKLNGFLSFHVMFQCKKYQGSVSPSHIRDFRGAMQGRADKGLFITTGTFTREATKESTRDGAPPIDLIDGDQLVEKLKELKLGIQTKLVESVEVDENWFKTI